MADGLEAVAVQLIGLVWLFNIVMGGFAVEVNAFFAVNLVTSACFSAKFLTHIAIEFQATFGDRKRRAVKTLKKLGSTIVVGVGVTKILGILGLAFASAALFRIYFFHMYLLMAVLGIFNSLFLLPIVLSWIGPSAVSTTLHGLSFRFVLADD